MAFSSVSWTNGDTITEVKLDQMIANDEYVKEGAEFKYILNGYAPGGSATTPSTSASPVVTVTLNIGGAQYGTAYSKNVNAVSGNEDFRLENVNVSAVSSGVHDIDLDLETSFGSGSYDFTAFTDRFTKIIKTEDIKRVTVFGNFRWTKSIGPGPNYEYSWELAKRVTIIAHTDDEIWT